jgi:predicted Zn finger-like uncharacterized protein
VDRLQASNPIENGYIPAFACELAPWPDLRTVRKKRCRTMIIQCEGCASKYFLPETKVPSEPLRVRCPQCRAAFTLFPQTEKVVAGPQEAMISSAAETAQGASVETQAPATEASFAEAQAEAVTAAPGSAKSDRMDARARRLARVLVSDILCYNQERRDQALIDGNLMAVLGDEIKKSWELYKEKVGADIANSTNYFKEALNEILADGQKVF